MNERDTCHKEVYGFAILGVMDYDKVEGRKYAHVCMDCMDTYPCGVRGSWNNGLVTCRHGYIYDLDYKWDGQAAQLLFKFVKRKWWGFIVGSHD